MNKLLNIIFTFILLSLAPVNALPQLVAGGDTTICQGGHAQLTATGGGVSYYWISVPTDPSLLIPQQQNPIVSPQVSTMYIVQSNIATGNLILNGSFELGNMGFSSEYVNNQVSIVAEGTYAVVTDAHTVHPNFFCNHDHTSGSGKFMAVNGAGVPNVQVWYLTLANVQPETKYEFSTWITSLHETNPATLQFSINGQLMGEPFQAYSYTCDWYQFFHIWDSDTNYQATISIVNQNTILSGNDFALDDISFATVIVYYDTVYVEVLPQYNSLFSSPSAICAQEIIDMIYTGNAPDTAIYHWDFGGGTVISGSGQGPYEVQYNTSGNFNISLWVEGTGCTSDTTVKALLVGDSPVVNVVADETILPYGGTTVLHGEYTGGQGPFSWSWNPSDLLTNPAILDPETLPLTLSTTFYLEVLDSATGCVGVSSVFIQVAGGPLGVQTTADPDEICTGENSVITAIGSGGTGNYIYHWVSNPPGFTSNLPSITVNPLQTTVYTVTIDDGLSVMESSVTVVVHSLPIADAGSDQTIPYGTLTTLNGEASGGSGQYAWHWGPSEWLMNPYVQDPQTYNLTTSILFSLYITDISTGCVSLEDFVMVNIEGGPLSVSIQTEDPEICEGESSLLMALASGGNQGNYTYIWSDQSGNSYPSTASISVLPDQTTTFHVLVNDGFNSTDAFFTLTVHPSTQFILASGNDTIIVCPYDTIVLTPEPNPPDWEYLWSNGSSNDTIIVGTTGIGFDIKSYSLKTSSVFGCNYTDEVVIIFDFGSCSGLQESSNPSGLEIYPNPGIDQVIIKINDRWKYNKLQIFNLLSKKIVNLDISRSNNFSENIKIDLAGYPAGIYIVLLSGENCQTSGKLILNP